jgi:hypothetical protein
MPRVAISLMAAALVLLLPLPASACVPVAAKTWSGGVQTSSIGAIESVSFNEFRVDCAWAVPELNGLDARAFNVKTHRGLPSTISFTTSALLDEPATLVWGYVLDDACQFETGPVLSPGRDVEVTKASAKAFSIPDDATWLVLTPTALTLRGPYEVKVTSPGRTCPKL